MQQTDATHTSHVVLTELEGEPCLECDHGELERGEYKDNTAVVCNDCGTPRAQLW